MLIRHIFDVMLGGKKKIQHSVALQYFWIGWTIVNYQQDSYVIHFVIKLANIFIKKYTSHACPLVGTIMTIDPAHVDIFEATWLCIFSNNP